MPTPPVQFSNGKYYRSESSVTEYKNIIRGTHVKGIRSITYDGLDYTLVPAVPVPTVWVVPTVPVFIILNIFLLIFCDFYIQK